MNIHFQPVEKKSLLSSYLLVAFATFTVLMLVLSMSRQVEIHFSVPAISIQAVQPVNSDLPVAVPAPMPPAEATTAISTPEPDWNAMSMVIPQAIPAPAPSVP
ncbi:MAG TPA: hypothetical protein PK152_01685 [Anaerolineales bacterium]|nr:hypothetical protein [Anaerolineae bacterium]HRJ59421.1 hypothetical protein [Anaerolineales bacterium]HRK87815.1 hypothetical protein [Anaerolineales bacterium]